MIYDIIPLPKNPPINNRIALYSGQAYTGTHFHGHENAYNYLIKGKKIWMVMNDINDYNKILQNQEIKRLEPLNQMANLEVSELMKNKKVDIMSKSADDFYSIINDLTNLGAGKYSSSKNNIEEFDNSIRENMDLSENSMGEYIARLEKQIRGSNSKEDYGMFNNFKDYFYNVFSILTKDGRIMTSGILFIIVAMGLYFIDISS